jgi:hypothetical protein
MPGSQRWVLGPEVTQNNVIPLTGSTVIIGDIGYWMQNQTELEADLQDLGAERRGVVLWFPDSETRTIWLLRWSSQ